LSEYRIFETKQFQNDLIKKLGVQEEKIVKKLRYFVYPQLKTQPFFGRNIKKLKGFRPETWRYRIGDYRFFYEVDEKKKIVFMIAAESRQKSY
jgi:mRNA interferase RelE/StbE